MTDRTESLRAADGITAALLALGTFLAGCIWAYPCSPPGAWGDAAVAAGLRPAAHVAGGLATLVAEGAFRLFGVAGGETALRLLGPATLAGVAAGVFVALRETLVLALRGRPQLAPRRRAVTRLGAAFGAIAFGASEPVWTCAQSFGESLLQIALAVGALALNLVFLRTGRLALASLGALALGLLTAESPLGLGLAVGLVALDGLVLRSRAAPEAHAFDAALPADGALPSNRALDARGGLWVLTLFLGTLVAGVALDALTYVRHDGLLASGPASRDVMLVYLREQISSLVALKGCAGDLTTVAVSCVLFGVMLATLPTAADEERFLPFTAGFVAFVCALLSLGQVAGAPTLWFGFHAGAHAHVPLALGRLADSFVVAFAVVTFGVEVFCRDHARLAEEQFDAVLPKPIGRVWRRTGFTVGAALAFVALVAGLGRPTARAMLGVVRDTVREIVDEAGEAPYLVTDGALDAAIELEAAARGHALCCLSLMGDNSPRETYLRTRGFAAGSEDRAAFARGAAPGLSAWIRDKPARLRAVAALLGFDLWLRGGKPLPKMGGLLARPAGFPNEAARVAGVRRARVLAARALAVHERRGGASACADEEIRQAFFDVQWRLASQCRYRGDADGHAAGRVDAALAKRLNARNPKVQDLVRFLSAQHARVKKARGR